MSQPSEENNDSQDFTLGSESEARAEEAKLRGFKPLRDLPPFLVAAVILWFVLRGRDWDAILAAMGKANLPLFIAGAGLYTLGHFLINGLSYRYIYHWFLVRVRTTEILKAYGAALLPQAVISAAGQVLLLIYMIRKKRLKLWPVVGLGFFFVFCDLCATAAALALALILKPKTEPLVYLWFGVMVPIVLVTAWYFPGRGGKKLFPWFYHSRLTLALRVAAKSHYAKFIFLRMTWPLFQVISHFIALTAMGIHAPLGAVIIIVTLMTLTTFLPVSALGFGAPNWAATYFAPYIAVTADPAATAIAYGILFQTCFLIGRLLIGSLMVFPFWKEATAQDADLEHVQHHGEPDHVQ